MSEHHSKSTTGVLKFCNTCNRKTMHSVSGKREGHCTEHEPNLLTNAQERQKSKGEEYDRNLGLFG